MAKRVKRERSADLIQRIRDRYDSLSESHKKVAEFVLDNLEVATFVSLNEISGRIGVSDATLIRFAQEMGYGGFKEFREHLADYIRKIIYTQKPTLEHTEAESSALGKVMAADIQYITRTLEGVNGQWFKDTVAAIVSAKRIYCMGWRISSFLAEFLAFQLRRLSYDAHPIVRERRTLLEQVLELGKGDLLIVFDQLLYSTEVFEAVEYVGVHAPEVTIVTVTNDPLAQIVQYADMSFFLDLVGQRDFSIISLTAPMSLINAIIEEVIAKKPRKAKRALTRYEDDVLSRQRHALVLKPKP